MTWPHRGPDTGNCRWQSLTVRTELSWAMHGASPWTNCAPVHDLVDFCFPLRLWMVRTLWWRSAEPVRPRQLPLWRKVITKQWILLKISVEKTFIHKVICLRSLRIWEDPHLHHSILWPFVCLWQLGALYNLSVRLKSFKASNWLFEKIYYNTNASSNWMLLNEKQSITKWKKLSWEFVLIEIFITVHKKKHANYFSLCFSLTQPWFM